MRTKRTQYIAVDDTGKWFRKPLFDDRLGRHETTVTRRDIRENLINRLTRSPSHVKGSPVDAVIDEGWADITAPLKFPEPIVSRVMDGVQRYIANVDDRPADEVERAAAAITVLADQHLDIGAATEVDISTTDIAAGEGAETVLASEGYGDSVTFVNGFRFIEDFRSSNR